MIEAEMEQRARLIAARKMGLVNDPRGERISEDLWRQAIPDVEKEMQERGGGVKPSPHWEQHKAFISDCLEKAAVPIERLSEHLEKIYGYVEERCKNSREALVALRAEYNDFHQRVASHVITSTDEAARMLEALNKADAALNDAPKLGDGQ